MQNCVGFILEKHTKSSSFQTNTFKNMHMIHTRSLSAAKQNRIFCITQVKDDQSQFFTFHRIARLG